MAKKQQTVTDRVYKLLSGSPISYTLPSRNNPRFPLMYWDEAKNVNRVLRYASNQKSPFEDEQDGNVILEPIVFEDGLLHVPKTNPVLQSFLHYHPLNGIGFAEVDKEKEASEDLDYINVELDAMVAARELTLDQTEMLTRVLLGKDPSMISTAELKRDLLVFAKQEPYAFLNAINDPDLKFDARVRRFFEERLLILKNGDKELWYNTPSNKKKIANIPFGYDPHEFASSYLKSDDGLDGLKMLETLMDPQ